MKPLYLGRHRGSWWFASELAAARACGLVESELRPEALEEFLVYRFIPSPGTPFRHAWKLPPSHFCRLPLAHLPGEPTFQRFDGRFAPAVVPETAAEWGEALRSALVDAIRRQLMSDVPVASLLSGGVDSTAVTRVMRDHLSAPPEAFAVGFADEQAGGELAAARRAAAALGLRLTEVAVTGDEYLEAWPQRVASLGEPIADSSSLLVDLVCRAVGRTHKVVLTGQGADEALGGYPRHAAERLYPLERAVSPLWRFLPERFAASDRVARARRVAAEPDRARRFTEILAVFSPREATLLTGHPDDGERLAAPVRRWLGTCPEGDSLNALLHVDARLSLADDLLIIADHMAMASSVELRVPFLDLELSALVDRMPSRYKVSRLGERKWLYRRAVRPLLPQDLRRTLLGWRARTGRKLGFTTPFEGWFARWIAQDAERFLLGAGARLPAYLRVDAVRHYLDAVRERRLPRSRQLMTLFALESWLRQVQPSAAPLGEGRVEA